MWCQSASTEVFNTKWYCHNCVINKWNIMLLFLLLLCVCEYVWMCVRVCVCVRVCANLDVNGAMWRKKTFDESIAYVYWVLIRDMDCATLEPHRSTRLHCCAVVRCMYWIDILALHYPQSAFAVWCGWHKLFVSKQRLVAIVWTRAGGFPCGEKASWARQNIKVWGAIIIACCQNHWEIPNPVGTPCVLHASVVEESVRVYEQWKKVKMWLCRCRPSKLNCCSKHCFYQRRMIEVRCVCVFVCVKKGTRSGSDECSIQKKSSVCVHVSELV